mmetsp:Transcript_14255/g.37773  ORF Transcript_14255/g.37773 Transcript_14255/m.37773 type:complete len:112 (-) Transcript_14255:615-950(-)
MHKRFARWTPVFEVWHQEATALMTPSMLLCSPLFSGADRRICCLHTSSHVFFNKAVRHLYPQCPCAGQNVRDCRERLGGIMCDQSRRCRAQRNRHNSNADASQPPVTLEAR